MKLEQILTQVVEKLQGWADGFVAMLPNLVVAMVVVALFGLLARVISRIANRALTRASSNQQIASLLTVTVRLAVFSLGLFVALGVLKLDKTVTSLLAGVGVVGLALGFAFQDIAANFMSGIIMAIRHPFSVGDLIETHDHLGYVERVTLRATVLRLFTGQHVVIPNKDVLQSPIKNYTDPGERRVDVECGVSYATDLDEARRIAIEAVETVEGRDSSRPVELYYTGFGSSSVDFSLRFWLDLEQDGPGFLEVRSRAIVALKQAFDEHGISIPFPIRTLDFGMEGGRSLAQELAERSAA